MTIIEILQRLLSQNEPLLEEIMPLLAEYERISRQLRSCKWSLGLFNPPVVNTDQHSNSLISVKKRIEDLICGLSKKAESLSLAQFLEENRFLMTEYESISNQLFRLRSLDKTQSQTSVFIPSTEPLLYPLQLQLLLQHNALLRALDNELRRLQKALEQSKSSFKLCYSESTETKNWRLGQRLDFVDADLVRKRRDDLVKIRRKMVITEFNINKIKAQINKLKSESDDYMGYLIVSELLDQESTLRGESFRLMQQERDIIDIPESRIEFEFDCLITLYRELSELDMSVELSKYDHCKPPGSYGRVSLEQMTNSQSDSSNSSQSTFAEERVISEDQAQELMQRVVEAVGLMHEKGIVHGKLGAKSFMLDIVDGDYQVFITGFNLDHSFLLYNAIQTKLQEDRHFLSLTASDFDGYPNLKRITEMKDFNCNRNKALSIQFLNEVIAEIDDFSQRTDNIYLVNLAEKLKIFLNEIIKSYYRKVKKDKRALSAIIEETFKKRNGYRCSTPIITVELLKQNVPIEMVIDLSVKKASIINFRRQSPDFTEEDVEAASDLLNINLIRKIHNHQQDAGKKKGKDLNLQNRRSSAFSPLK